MAIGVGEKPAGVLAPAGQHGNRLKAGSIGLFAVVFMALAGSAPITAMTGNVPIVVGYGVGKYAPAGFIVALVVLTIFTVGYAAMSRHVTATGSFYGYISQGLGQVAGMASGLLSTLAYIVFEASLIGIFASFARSTISSFGGPSIPWIWIALVGIAIIAVMGYFDIKLSGRVLAVFLVTEILILLIMSFAVLFKGGGPSGLVPTALNPAKAFTAVPSSAAVVGSAGVGLFFCFWSWVGFETVAVYGEESRDPKRIVPRGLFIAVVSVGILYVFVSWMVIAGNGVHHAIAVSQGSSSFTLFFLVTRSYVGVWAEKIYQVLIITGSFACALAFHNAASRYMYALGREMPSKKIRATFGATHKSHGSPHICSLVQTLITLAITLCFFWFQHPTKAAPTVAYDYQYGLMAILGTMILLICQAVVSLSVISYFHIRKQHPETKNFFRTLLAPLIGAVGMVYVVYLLFKNLTFAAGLAAGSPVFKAIPWIVLGTAVIGVAYALYMRMARPDDYAAIGRTVLEEAHERDEEPASVAPAGAVTP